MTYGMQSINGSNVLNIDENLKAYVYAGKYAIPDTAKTAVVTFSCVGYPMLFFGVPHNVSAGDPTGSSSIGWTGYIARHGVSLAKLVSSGANQWTAYLTVANPSNSSLGLFLRVFGRLDLNYPSGSGQQFGMQVFNASSQLVFDSNLKMLRLAANTYDIEVTLSAAVPNGTQGNSACDAIINVPFDMSGKSICANSRAIIHWPYQIGSYTQFDTGLLINQYQILNFESLYWSTGSQLHVRRIATSNSEYETPSSFVIDNSTAQTVYSRLAVIDNSLFF
ncbi:hypothetical protein ACO0K0_02380 [Undibacterium sp. SXout11W]|uniref:hypothetical protein n=1 Tax=Undibacterium sp. SXout11W TaxID=3413050 RepID=UPI003BF0F8F0